MVGDLWIRGGTIVTAGRTFVGDVIIRNGRIDAVVERGGSGDEDRDASEAGDGSGDRDAAADRDASGDRGAAADRDRFGHIPVLDATGKFVLPGLIDVHVHFRDPGLIHKEDFRTGTLAAACGGVTTVFDMPNTLPPVATADVLRAKADGVRGRAHVDYGFYGLVDEHNGDELRALVDAGAIGFKLFLGPTTGDLRAPGWGRLIEVFETVREIGLPLVIHAEDRDVIEYWTAKVEAGWRPDAPSQVGRLDDEDRPEAAEQSEVADQSETADPSGAAFNYEAFLATRPRFGEVAATQTACLLAQMTGARIHIAHVALAEAVEVIRQAKAAGAPVTAETCPTYLTMTADDCEALGPVSKILPPIRSGADREALWAGLHDGTIDLIATDHAPHERAAKTGDWLRAAGGMIGVETMLPLLLNEVSQGRLTLNKLVEWTSANPADLFGMAARKGDLRAGLDGDVVVVDPDAERVIGSGEPARAPSAVPARSVSAPLHSKSDNSSLLGRKLRGAVVHTVVRGRVVVRDGRPVGGPLGERVVAPFMTPSGV